MSTATGVRLKTSFSLPTPMTAVAISANGRFVASTAGEGVIIIWDTSTSEKLSTVPAPDSLRLDRLAVSDDGRWLAAGTSNLFTKPDPKGDAIRVWDLSGPGSPLSHTQVGMTNFTLQFSPRGNRLLIRQSTDCWWLDLNNGAAIGKNIPLAARIVAQRSSPNTKQYAAPAPRLLGVRYTSAPENTSQINVELLQWPIAPRAVPPAPPRPAPPTNLRVTSVGKLPVSPTAPTTKRAPGQTAPTDSKSDSPSQGGNLQRETLNKPPAQEPPNGSMPAPVEAQKEKGAQQQVANPADSKLRGDVGSAQPGATESGNSGEGASAAAPAQTSVQARPAAPSMLTVNGASSADSAPNGKAPPSMSALVFGTSYSGDDYTELNGVATADDCSRACGLQALCRSMTYAKSTKKCWLKRSVPPAQYGDDFVSAVKLPKR
jgi:hypothetical protein